MSNDHSPNPARCRCEEQAGEPLDFSPVCIGHLWLFRNLSAVEQEALSRSAVRKKSGKGSLLFRQGDPADALFLIKGGRLKLSKVFEDGREVTLDIRKSGDFVGETLLSEAADYPVSAWCLEDTLTCGFDRRGFEQLVLAHPHIGLQIIRNMSERITSLTDRLGGLAGGPIEDRLLQTLVDLSREHGVSHRQGKAIQLNLTHEDLSFLIGAHRVSVTRAIKNLKRSGKIIADGRNLIIPI
jgi:CRP/FNR family transcriptional regulator, cyclic AMP receptor protein